MSTTCSPMQARAWPRRRCLPALASPRALRGRRRSCRGTTRRPCAPLPMRWHRPRSSPSRCPRTWGWSRPRLAATTEQLASGLREAAAAADGHPVQVVSAPGLLTVFFSAEPVRSFADARACDLSAHAAWCRELLARGVYPPPSQFEAWFPSLAHTAEQVDRTVEAAAAAFDQVAEAVR